MSAPCVIFDSHHPKHYLTLRELGRRCRDHGIDVVWTARRKDVLVDLMRQDGLDPEVLTTARNGLLGKIGELVVYDWKLARLARKHRASALMGKTIAVAQVGRLLGIPSLVVNDDARHANPQYPYLAYPFATRILTPECLGEDYGRRHRRFPGLCELAYLHPDVFTPDPGVRAELGVGTDTPIFIIRLVALRATHDIGAKGLSQAAIRRLIERLGPVGRVLISSEAALHPDLVQYRFPLPASRMHHALAAAHLLICDSQSMAAEAGVLGTTSLRISSFVGKLPYLEELEQRFGLTYGFTPSQEEVMFAKLDELLAMVDLKGEWARRRRAMLAEWGDPTDVFWEELQAFLQRPAPGQSRPDLPRSTPS